MPPNFEPEPLDRLTAFSFRGSAGPPLGTGRTTESFSMAGSCRLNDVNRGWRAFGPWCRLAPIAALFAALGVLAAPAPVGAAAVPVPKLSWQPCAKPAQEGLQCATVRGVPLDYSRPRGRTIHLAVIRHRANDPAHRIGSLFFNPGGPGGAGTTALAYYLGRLSPAVLARFDIVSWDPRGGGESSAVRCFSSAAAEKRFFDGTVYAYSFPVGNREMGEWVRRYRALGQRCQHRSGRLLRHVSTTDTARDLNLLRRAVGDRRLSYNGVSYGTFLGATYANLFPNRVRAMVLDGNLDPVPYLRRRIGANGGRFLTTDLRARADLGAERTLNAFLDLCGAVDSDCAFSAGSPAATRARYAALLERLQSSPQGMEMTYAEVVSGTAGLLFSTALWPELATILQDLWSTGTAEPTLAKRPLAASGAVAERVGPVMAIRCSESPNPPLAEFRLLDGFAFRRSGPLGPWWSWLSLACGSWPATAADRYNGPWDRRTANPVLVTSTTHDPSTPYRGAKAMAQRLSRARLLTVDGYGHTVLGNPSTCASRYMTRYLIRKVLPPKGTRCEQDEVPFQGAP